MHLHLAGTEPAADGATLGLIGARGSVCGLIFHLGVERGMATTGYKPILIATAVLHPLAAVVVWWLVREPLAGNVFDAGLGQVTVGHAADGIVVDEHRAAGQRKRSLGRFDADGPLRVQ